MKNIAENVKIGHATLYRYYLQNEQLAFNVANLIISEIANDIVAYGKSNGNKGFEKLKAVSIRLLDLLKVNANILSYLSEFDIMFNTPYPGFDKVKQFTDNIHCCIDMFSEIIDEGKADESIKSSLPTSLLASVFINQIFGVSQRVLPRSQSIKNEKGYSGEEIVLQSILLFLETLK